jgi:hypothetical protein
MNAMKHSPPPRDKESLDPVQIPGTLLVSFFESAKERLNEHPNTEMQQDLLTDDAKGEMIPVSLASQRHFLLQEQVAALKTSISEYNLSKDKVREFQEEEVQDCLRDLGQNDFSKISTNDQIGKDALLKAMTEMNEAARSAFARSVLWAEVKFSKEMLQKYPLNEVPFQGLIDYGKGGRNLLLSNDGNDGMTRSAALEFSGLCTTGAHLPEVKRHFETGFEIFNTEGSNEGSQTRMSVPQHRFLQFQQMMLCAVGYEPRFGGEELRKWMMKDDISEDSELFEALSKYFLAMQDAAKDVFTNLPEELSDETEGGVTRIVSVEHKEKILNERGELIDSQGSAPTSETMRNDDAIRKNTSFDMAQKASTLQSLILKELLSMDESERNEVLKEASEANETFLAEVVALPPGSERVRLIQNIGKERQSLLLKHKLWQQHLAK